MYINLFAPNKYPSLPFTEIVTCFTCGLDTGSVLVVQELVLAESVSFSPLYSDRPSAPASVFPSADSQPLVLLLLLALSVAALVFFSSCAFCCSGCLVATGCSCGFSSFFTSVCACGFSSFGFSSTFCSCFSFCSSCLFCSCSACFPPAFLPVSLHLFLFLFCYFFLLWFYFLLRLYSCLFTSGK